MYNKLYEKKRNKRIPHAEPSRLATVGGGMRISRVFQPTKEAIWLRSSKSGDLQSRDKKKGAKPQLTMYEPAGLHAEGDK